MPSNPAPFVRKTFELVSDANTDHIVSWSPDGLSFVIHDTHEFQQNILPFYFKHNNLCSFVRQLNTYGFRKVVTGDSSGNLEFKQTSFKQGKPQLLRKVVRRKSGTKRSRSEFTCDSPDYVSSPEYYDDVSPPMTPEQPSCETMLETIANITERQEQTKNQIQELMCELAEAKRQIKELEALPDHDKTDMEPPLKMAKVEVTPADPIDEFWFDVESPEILKPDDYEPLSCVPLSVYEGQQEPCAAFDLRGFLLETPCIQV
uniref:HSF-type DNA-binding domain-containing protein n=1 Tax=Vannella robusta TaxID=1487602 RepID=A0A7S4HGU4_9EUKA|mmetsp:Transcript_10074/g.12403  ORF Transcript_10074/g.12403 Transcript_10074/m.12403 type:complete len:260 (+) Transcript_10074:124-903(+)|eukprot:CAMPEP_0206193778 /NCGR_PEP_ID=MMETSP0166-20121206/6781_1 /ASSEMBLY_ACC=CAM_ASM_000260 /TAXON_ID=95228 /ORGANISM="Vannella robusta, Strain DIVA3 518/3/11/1/6" /LENGTH=259 /DNA_ID=CAMNT_0053610579 /DNA_START=41 /DNA_END=820 /DNA_ORIENTATION=-